MNNYVNYTDTIINYLFEGVFNTHQKYIDDITQQNNKIHNKHSFGFIFEGLVYRNSLSQHSWDDVLDLHPKLDDTLISKIKDISKIKADIRLLTHYVSNCLALSTTKDSMHTGEPSYSANDLVHALGEKLIESVFNVKIDMGELAVEPSDEIKMFVLNNKRAKNLIKKYVFLKVIV